VFRSVVGFELRYQLRQPLLWATAGLFALMGFVVTSTDALEIGGSIGGVNRNAPWVVARLLGNMSVLGIFIVVAFVATSVLRDFERGTDELVFSRPVRVRDLLLGRFAGALLAACFCFAFAALGIGLGSAMPWLDPERVGPFVPAAYVYGLGVLAFPSFAIFGGLLVALATRVRHMVGVYLALVALLVAYFTAVALSGDLESRSAAALLDPFGLMAFEQQTRYWTVAEKNLRLPPVGGEMLWSRVLWLGLGLGALAWAVARFRYDQLRRHRGPVPRAAAEENAPGVATRLRAQPGLGPHAFWPQLASQFRLELRAVVLSVPFLLMLAFSLINVIANMGQLDLMLGTPVWPVTYLMLLAVRAGYSFLLIVIVTFYAGEAVWRERSLKLDGVCDATPAPSAVPLLAKLLALWAACFVFMLAGVAGLAGYQLSHGYTRLQPLLYAQGLVVETLPFLLAAVLAVALQVALNHKLLGYLAMVLYLVSGAALDALHFDHFLYRYGEVPRGPYSDMNGWGHFAAPMAWFNAYWCCAALVLVVLSHLGWVRGVETGLRHRFRLARARLTGRTRLALAASIAGFVALGGFIFYNTNVRNEYLPSDEAERRAAEYEKTYGGYRNLAQPRIAGIRADVAIFPAERRVEIRGSYRLVNRSLESIASLHVAIPSDVLVRALELPPHKVAVDDRRLGHAVYELATPLAPGQEMPLGFQLELANPGFVASGANNEVAENGTFLHNRSTFPSLGYQTHAELDDPSARRKHALPALVRMAKIDDPVARLQNDLAHDADWLELDTTVSTSPDQIAIAPGELEREWTEGGRRYFHYRPERPIPKFFAFLSARYTVRRDAWKGTAIEVFHHPGHEYNVDRMLGAVRKTLDYMTESFSPYQHHGVRIVEFPRYSRRAASFPGTIPFSESIGFIARRTSPEAIDYPFYVTAHEVAHQWWGYQVLGADVQGATMLSETMAQYSALMVMEREYGPGTMRRFLRYELDRYLSGRGGERLEELPLALVEDQPYVHYSKGGLALYALKDALGESVLNGALRRYVESVRFKAPPYTVSRDLLSFVAEATPPEKRGLLADLFESITLFDLEAAQAVSRKLVDGRYEVTLTATARKLRADGQGAETEVPLDDWIDVGVLGEKEALYLQKVHVTGREVTARAIVTGRPVRAGIDPYNKLIDRTPSDNVRAVTER